MNLGDLIDALEAEDPNVVLRDGFGEPSSYRGDYSEIAFEPAIDVTIGSMLEHARSAVGRTFRGYKGGTYLMDRTTIVNVAEYGRVADEAEITTWRLKAMLASRVDPDIDMTRNDSLRIVTMRRAIENWQAVPQDLRASVGRDLLEQRTALFDEARNVREHSHGFSCLDAHADRMEQAVAAYDAASAILQIAAVFRLSKETSR